MPATVDINRFTGAITTDINDTTKTALAAGNTRASTSDSPTPGTGNPIPIPASGVNYSFWVSTRLVCTVAPSGTIDNLRWFSDGTNSWAAGASASGQSASLTMSSGYRVATGTVGTTGNELTVANHPGLTNAKVDVFSLTSGAPKALFGSTTFTQANGFGDFFVYQITIASTASPGTLTPAEVFSFRYDET